MFYLCYLNFILLIIYLFYKHIYNLFLKYEMIKPPTISHSLCLVLIYSVSKLALKITKKKKMSK